LAEGGSITTTLSTGERSAVLLERQEALASLSAWLGEVTAERRGRLVFVCGEAGVGKTLMLRRFCDELAPDARVLWGSCDPLSTPRPLGPFVDVARLTGGELGDLVERDALPHEVAAALLDELAAAVPTVLVIEDAHWADEGTLDVLRLLGRRVRGTPALVIATYRDDSLDRSHPLRVVLGELATSDVGARLRLQPLSLDAVARLAEPHDIDADDLYRNTAGNPFFVSEVLAAGPGEIPETVRDAVLARASRLSLRARIVLDAASVSSLSTELWLLEALAGEAIDSVSECVDSGMLTPQGEGVAFRHELARIAIEESLSPHQRLRLHQRALAALVVRPAESLDAARVTHHAVAAGDAEAVSRFAPIAARRATSLGAHREAAAQYAAALRFGERLPPAERAELLELRSRACYLTDQYDEGIASLEQALEVHRALGDTLRQGEALRRLSNFLWCPGRIAESERSARAAVALLEESPPGRELAAAYANLAWLCGCGMRSEDAVAWAGRAIELATRFDAKEIDIDAHTTIAACQDYNQLEQSLEHARKAGTDEQVGRIFVPLAAIAVETRRHALATKYLDAGIAYCSERGYELFRLYLLAYRARLELDQGRWSEAADSAASVLRIRRTSTTPRIQALVVLGLLRARRGDPGQWDALDEAWALFGNERTAKYLQSCWKLSRAYGVANIAVIHRLSDLRAQADDGTSTAKVSMGLLADTQTRVLFRQSPDQAPEARVIQAQCRQSGARSGRGVHPACPPARLAEALEEHHFMTGCRQTGGDRRAGGPAADDDDLGGPLSLRHRQGGLPWIPHARMRAHSDGRGSCAGVPPRSGRRGPPAARPGRGGRPDVLRGAHRDGCSGCGSGGGSAAMPRASSARSDPGR